MFDITEKVCACKMAVMWLLLGTCQSEPISCLSKVRRRYSCRNELNIVIFEYVRIMLQIRKDISLDYCSANCLLVFVYSFAPVHISFVFKTHEERRCSFNMHTLKDPNDTSLIKTACPTAPPSLPSASPDIWRV